MAIYRCKMCGAQLEVEEGSTVATCDYCGSKQTVANADDERKEALYNRANDLRAHNEFDKAILAYQSILSIFPDEPEAHWGITLCRYGIEYVDDPVTKAKKPTIHRISFDSILKDSDYVAALAYADVVAREVYQEQAKEIADIQKNLLAISQKEEPFDIFICYKETGDNDKRTPDSVLAQEIYEALAERGYKVFFARITLENKLGTMYEPYIFAALNSAKIMLVIGTQKAYFDAVWVKNEWSRFLDLMKTRPDRYLIPCYKDMNAYDMPEEFLSLQAQNLAKLGFLQDLIRGIDKMMGKEAQRQDAQTNVVLSDVNIKALLTRAEILIGDKDYQKADDLLERVLNNDPMNSQAYLLKLLIELQVTSVDDLKTLGKTFRDNRTFKKAYDFGDEAQKKRLAWINDYIDERNEQRRLDSIYQEAKQLMGKGEYLRAKTLFASIPDYKDAKERREECVGLVYSKAKQLMEAGEYSEAESLFASIPEYKDGKEQATKCLLLEENARKESIYQSCIFEKGLDLHQKPSLLRCALEKLAEISGYKDADQLAVEYRRILNEYEENRARIKAEMAEKERRKERKKGIVRASVIGGIPLVGVLLALTFIFFVPNGMLNRARELVDSGKYSKALSVLSGYNQSYSSKEATKLGYLANAGLCFERQDYNAGIGSTLAINNWCSHLGIDAIATVNYDSNGGSSDLPFQTFTGRDYSPEQKHTYITNKVTKDGWFFDGWLVDSFKIVRKNYSVSLTLKASFSDPQQSTDQSFFDFTLDEASKTAEIVGYRGCASNVRIPSSYEKNGQIYHVISIRNCLTEDQSVTSLILPDTLETIGPDFASHCGNLVSVTVGSGVKNVDSDFLYFCPKLVEVINKSTLTRRWSLYADFIITDPADSQIVFDYSNDGFITYRYKTEKYLAAYAGGLENISVPKGITDVRKYAFYGLSATNPISTVDLPSGLVRIGRDAFSYSDVQSLFLPDTLESIEEYAFYACYDLESIFIPSSVKTMGQWVFSESKMTIYCEAASKPYGWEYDWNHGYASVVWGATRDQAK